MLPSVVFLGHEAIVDTISFCRSELIIDCPFYAFTVHGPRVESERKKIRVLKLYTDETGPL